MSNNTATLPSQNNPKAPLAWRLLIFASGMFLGIAYLWVGGTIVHSTASMDYRHKLIEHAFSRDVSGETVKLAIHAYDLVLYSFLSALIVMVAVRLLTRPLLKALALGLLVTGGAIGMLFMSLTVSVQSVLLWLVPVLPSLLIALWLRRHPKTPSVVD